MALLDWTDYEAPTNSTLSDPDGRAFANRVADSILAWSARYCNQLGRAKTTYAETLSPDWPEHVARTPGRATTITGVSAYRVRAVMQRPYTRRRPLAGVRKRPPS